MTARAPRRPLAPTVALALAAIVAALLLLAPALRSTETWITTDPAVARRLLDLAAEQRRLKHDWEGASRGDARFALDTEIRVVGAQIAALEAEHAPPRRTVGLSAWHEPLRALPRAAAIAVETAVESVAALALAVLACLALARLSTGSRRIVLALALAPLGLSPPIFADALARLAAALGLGPGPLLAGLGAVLAGFPFALVLVWTAARRVDPRQIEVARDLGFTPLALLRRVAWPPIAPAAAFAVAVVFVRLLDDLSIARRLGGFALDGRLGEWLRHRLVARVDFPGAAAGTLLAAALALAVAAAVWIRVSRPTAPPPFAPFRPIRPPAGPGPAVVPLALAPVLLGVLLAAGVFGDAPVPDGSARLLAVLVEISRALLATGLALVLAAGFADACGRGGPGLHRAAIGVAVAKATLPCGAVALSMRLLAEDAGLAAGPWIAVAASVPAAAGLAAVLLLGDPPRPDRPSAHRFAVAGRRAALAPLAAVLAFARALAASDLGTVVGVVDRGDLLVPPPAGTADPASLVAVAVALAVGFAAAPAIERARDRASR